MLEIELRLLFAELFLILVFFYITLKKIVQSMVTNITTSLDQYHSVWAKYHSLLYQH